MPQAAQIMLKDPIIGMRHLVNASFEDAEWQRFQADWLAYLKGQSPAPKGGAYTCTNATEKGSRVLLIRFDDVLAVI